MASWRDGVAREIPVDLPGDLLGWIEDAWKAFSRGNNGEQLGNAELQLVEERVRRFEPYRAPEQVQMLDAWRLHGESPVSLCLLVAGYQTVNPGIGRIPQRFTTWEDRFAGLLELRASGGEALVRPETITDKVSELFKRNEVDFEESPAFSRRYFVPASDEAKLRQAMTKEVLDHIATRNDLMVEIHDRDMLVVWPDAISKRSVVEVVAFLSELARRIGHPGGGPYRR